MVKIIGVRFRNAGKVYYFDPKSWQISTGDPVIVETARGIEYGTAVGGVREVSDDKIVQPLREVIRLATDEDIARALRNREKEKEALRICREKIQKHGLEMKLIDAEYTFDNNKVLFYFTADGRIDFRELVKDLAAVFRMRIELRQVGVRDETKLLGGIGICGRVLCCNSYLSDFAPVSIRMAKEQNLSLNPTKISGACGRLMCCLKNEEETYEYLNSRLPATGDSVTTADGRKGEVQSVNVLRQRVKVIFEENEEKELEEFDVSDLTFRPRRKKEKGGKNKEKEKDSGHSSDIAEAQEEKELRDLEALEAQDASREAASSRAPAKKRNFERRATKRTEAAHSAPEDSSMVDNDAENVSARAESRSRKGKAGRETHAHGS